MVIRSPETLLPWSERTVCFLPLILSPLPLVSSSSALGTQTDQECFGIPRRFPPWLSLRLRQRAVPPPGHSSGTVSPRAPITRRNAHLVHDGGPITVSNHSKLLSTHDSPVSHGRRDAALSSPLSSSSSAVHPRIFNPALPSTDYQSLGKHFRPTTAVLHVGVDGLHFLSR